MKVLIDLGNSEFAAKMMIETLCIAQSRIAASPLDKHRQTSDIQNLQLLISQIEAAMNRCQTCNGTGWESFMIQWDKPYKEAAMRPCTECKRRKNEVSD